MMIIKKTVQEIGCDTAAAADQDLRGDDGQRRAGADLDSTDCDAAGAVAADAEHVRLEFVQPGGAAAATAFCLQGLDDVAQPPLRIAAGAVCG